MVYGGTIWKIINLVLLKNPSLTVAQGAQIVREVKQALKAVEC